MINLSAHIFKKQETFFCRRKLVINRLSGIQRITFSYHTKKIIDKIEFFVERSLSYDANTLSAVQCKTAPIKYTQL